MVILSLHNTKVQQGYHMSKMGITFLYPYKKIQSFLVFVQQMQDLM